MKLRKYYLTVLTFLYFTLAGCTDEKLTDNALDEMLRSMEAAAEARDAEKLMLSFSKDAEIILEMPPSMGGKLTYSVQQYKDILEQGWAMPAEFAYEVTDRKILIDGSTAKVSAVVRETMEMNGRRIASTTTKEMLDIVLVDGKPRIKNFYGKVSM